MSKRPWHIAFGITGGIAAYKSLSLIRLLTKQGAEVKVVLTEHAKNFVTIPTLQALSRNAVYHDMYPQMQEVEVEHIALAEWADMLVVAPATANIIGKFANGIADDALSTLYLACQCPVLVAPAMNHNMLHHPAVQKNMNELRGRGVHFAESGTGELACGTNGDGRMQEPEQIFATICQLFQTSRQLEGKRALVTAGPTYEPIDPVRFVGNYSSGLMGFQLAEALASEGADVTLVSGPTHLCTNHPSIHRINIQTASEMLEVCQRYASDSDMIVMAAAVADYTPETVAPEKIKKKEDHFILPMKKNPDILAGLGAQKKENQCLVGFALETENELFHAQSKLKNKNADIIVLNSLRQEGAGFQCHTNRVTIIDRKGNMCEGTLKDKSEVAQDIVNYAIRYMNGEK